MNAKQLRFHECRAAPTEGVEHRRVIAGMEQPDELPRQLRNETSWIRMEIMDSRSAGVVREIPIDGLKSPIDDARCVELNVKLKLASSLRCALYSYVHRNVPWAADWPATYRSSSVRSTRSRRPTRIARIRFSSGTSVSSR